MATLTGLKSLAKEAGKEQEIHRILLENVLCGLDINKVAIQLAACNLTLGAPMADFKRMQLYTMPHGVDREGGVQDGGLELLNQIGEEGGLRQFLMAAAGIASAGG